jgi:hypothetical protein
MGKNLDPQHERQRRQFGTCADVAARQVEVPYRRYCDSAGQHKLVTPVASLL